WVSGPSELLQYRASDLRLLKTLAPDYLPLDNYGNSHFALTPDASYYAYGSPCNLGVYRADGSSVANYRLDAPYQNCGGGAPFSVSLSDDGQKVAWAAYSAGQNRNNIGIT